jgi:hypothetical protein
MGNPSAGPRAAFLLAPIWFAIGAWLLRPVDERRREGDRPAPPPVTAGVSPEPVG